MNTIRIFLTCCVLCALATNCSAQPESAAASLPVESPDIRITVAGMGAVPVVLVGMMNDQQYAVDKTQSDENGVAVFKRDEPYRQGMYFVLLPENANFQLLITEDQTFSVTTALPNLTENLQVEGSAENTLLADNNRYEAAYQARYRTVANQIKQTDKAAPNYAALEAQRDQMAAERQAYLDGLFKQHPNTFFTKFKRAGQNPEIRKQLSPEAQVTRYRMEFWDGVDLADERLLYTPVVYNKLKRYFEELTPQQPDSIIVSLERLVAKIPDIKGSEYYKYFVNWVALAYEPSKTTLMDAEAVFVHIVKNHFTNERAFWSDSTNTYALQLRADEMAYSLVGQPGPNVKVPDANGKPQAVYDLKAPYVVVYLYNPDCEHCQAETPVLVNRYRQWQQQSPPLVDVYAIAIDTEPDLWKSYIAKTGMTWTNVYDPTNRSIYKTYFVNITPEIYVLNPERVIIGKNLKVNQIDEIIRRDQEKRK